MLRDQDDRVPAGAEDPMELAEDFVIFLDVLEYVQADDRVERQAGERRIVVTAREVHREGPEVLEMAEASVNHLDIKRIEVADDQAVALEQELGEVADPATGLEHRAADVGGDPPVHPAVERSRVTDGDEDGISVVGREACLKEAAAKERRDRLQSVAPPHLLALDVGP